MIVDPPQSPACVTGKASEGAEQSWRPPQPDEATIVAEARQWVRQVLAPLLPPDHTGGVLDVAQLVASELVTQPGTRRHHHRNRRQQRRSPSPHQAPTLFPSTHILP